MGREYRLEVGLSSHGGPPGGRDQRGQESDIRPADQSPLRASKCPFAYAPLWSLVWFVPWFNNAREWLDPGSLSAPSNHTLLGCGNMPGAARAPEPATTEHARGKFSVLTGVTE